jgi:hypothetical protein
MGFDMPPGGNSRALRQVVYQARTYCWLRIDHVNSSIKRCRIVKERIRLWKESARDLVLELCCALHNFRGHLTPRQPMVSSGLTQLLKKPVVWLVRSTTMLRDPFSKNGSILLSSQYWGRFLFL